jgi:hypothetical protein
LSYRGDGDIESWFVCLYPIGRLSIQGLAEVAFQKKVYEALQHCDPNTLARRAGAG